MYFKILNKGSEYRLSLLALRQWWEFYTPKPLTKRATIAVLILELSRRRAPYNKWQIYRWAQYFRPYLMTWKNLVQWPLNPDIRAATGKRGPPPLQIGLSGQKGLFWGKNNMIAKTDEINLLNLLWNYFEQQRQKKDNSVIFIRVVAHSFFYILF